MELRRKILTGRDAVHKYLHDGGELEEIRNGVIYHCGPVMLKEGGEYRVIAAGPTTSIREEPYQADIIKRYGIKAVIGKGGMGSVYHAVRDDAFRMQVALKLLTRGTDTAAALGRFRALVSDGRSG